MVGSSIRRRRFSQRCPVCHRSPGRPKPKRSLPRTKLRSNHSGFRDRQNRTGGKRAQVSLRDFPDLRTVSTPVQSRKRFSFPIRKSAPPVSPKGVSVSNSTADRKTFSKKPAESRHAGSDGKQIFSLPEPVSARRRDRLASVSATSRIVLLKRHVRAHLENSRDNRKRDEADKRKYDDQNPDRKNTNKSFELTRKIFLKKLSNLFQTVNNVSGVFTDRKHVKHKLRQMPGSLKRVRNALSFRHF